jgi:hypothetical protein
MNEYFKYCSLPAMQKNCCRILPLKCRIITLYNYSTLTKFVSSINNKNNHDKSRQTNHYS